MAEHRENVQEELKVPIVKAMDSAGLQEDCPFATPQAGKASMQLDEDTVGDVDDDKFMDYMGRVNQYLQVGHSIPVVLHYLVPMCLAAILTHHFID